ncbi:hypothetical protein KPC83_00625 [Collinsella sp. zg1085]|uniref:SHIRT domain-containing protein n=1 Tax=Collinsella sp. zg1085 TaxID=2844380 RepID=UPI001C0C0BE9|nr:SHIRT domain-containing protein [Collinsella sp. zg1085]QWT17707.1 hypothetical protein KPC83_00625 [Collinsella sp. zg1085]
MKKQVPVSVLMSAALVASNPAFVLAREAENASAPQPVAEAPAAADSNSSTSADATSTTSSAPTGDSADTTADGDSADVAHVVPASPDEGTTTENGENAAPTAPVSYEGTVTFVGQWTNESRAMQNTTKEFHAENDKLGTALANGGLYRGIAKTFLGWSDKEPKADGSIAEGARLYSAEDTVKTAFPNGIPADAKLYGVYYSLNNPKASFPDDKFKMGTDLLGGLGKISTGIAKSNVIIESADHEGVLPNTTNHSASSAQGESVDNKPSRFETKIIDVYDANKDDVEKINEVVLRSHFTMNNEVAMLVYKNPVVGYGDSNIDTNRVLSRNYNPKFAVENGFSNAAGAKDYTYVDLRANFEEGITLPENLHMEFSGYSWRPLFVMNENHEKLEVFNPANDASLGSGQDAFKTLVSKTNPAVRFGVKTNGAKSVIIRCILRYTNDERIAESDVVRDGDKSIAETILSPMTLRSISTVDLKKERTDLAEDATALNSRAIQIKNAKAKELVELKKTLAIDGVVSGYAFADSGYKVSLFGLSLPVKSEQPIGPFASNVLRLGYISYKADYEYVSGTPGKELPEGIVALTPTPYTDLATGDEVPHGTPGEDVIHVEGGTWKFTSWYKGSVSEANKLTTLKSTIEHSDLHFVGVWVFEEDAPQPQPQPEPQPQPQPQPQPEPQPQPQPQPEPKPQPQPEMKDEAAVTKTKTVKKIKKVKKQLPQTSDAGIIASVATVVAGSVATMAGVVTRRKRKQ